MTADDVAAAFDYELRIPNEWEGVNMEVFGEPEKDGKLVADDVSGYKFITLRVFAKGPQYIRLELITRGQGANLESGYPTATFRVSPGFNTYKLKLDSFNQPQWAMPLDLKERRPQEVDFRHGGCVLRQMHNGERDRGGRQHRFREVNVRK